MPHLCTSIKNFIFPCFHDDTAELIYGNTTFDSPLGNTVQKFVNRNAKIKLKVSIFGDSHSSIYLQKRFTYLYASLFERCEFHWIPWGGEPENFASDADLVVMEISQRFLFT